MLEIAMLKSLVDLFKELLNIVDRGAKNRRETFEKTFKPLYERLEPVAKEYYMIIHQAAHQLEQPDPDFNSIVAEVEARRAGLIIVRNGVLGEADAFTERFFGSNAEAEMLKRGQFAELAYEFAKSVSEYFLTTELAFAREESVMTGFIIDLGILVKEKRGEAHREEWEPTYSVGRKRVLDDAKRALKNLESDWTTVSEKYARLKIYCET
jgi:hypothetical protein